MNQRASDAGLFPTDPVELEHVASAIVRESAGEIIGGAIELVRQWLASELHRCPSFVELPETYSDAAYFPPGYWQECAELFAWLGHMIGAGPERWQSSFERERERDRLESAMRSIALYCLQYVAGEHVERIAVVLPALRDQVARKRAADRRRGERAAAAKRSETWTRVALAAVLLAELGVDIPEAGHWQKRACRDLAGLGFGVEASFLKNNATELRAALAAIKSAMS